MTRHARGLLIDREDRVEEQQTPELNFLFRHIIHDLRELWERREWPG
jgi:hypothetical protein